MGYRIQYDATMTKETFCESKDKVQKNMLVSVVIISCLLLFLIFSLNTNAVRNFLLPGDAEITEAALIELMNNVREGESIRDSIAVFCLEIFENANSPK